MTFTAEQRTALQREYLDMIQYARPRDSATADEFCDRYLMPLGFTPDRHGNWRMVVQTDLVPDTLFASHYDTVAGKEGQQTVHFDGQLVALSKASKKAGFSCLGADDTSGIFLMVNMIRAGVPGVYVVHYGEESGCLGSRALVEDNPQWLRHIKKVVSFDRRGTKDIITHQMSGRTASDAFAKALATGLGMGHKPSDEGVYTDSVEYADIVPECTNVSVGYYREHSQDEIQDLPYLIDLLWNVIRVDWAALPAERAPGDYGSWGGDIIPDYGFRRTTAADFADMEDLVAMNPEVAATLLMAYGVDADELREEILMHRGM